MFVPWTRQPRGVSAVEIDPQHWIAPLVRQGYIAGPSRNAGSAYPVTSASAIESPSIGFLGHALTGSGGYATAPSVANSTAWTILSFGVLRSTGAASAIATIAESPGSGTVDRSLYINSSNSPICRIFNSVDIIALSTSTVPANRLTLIAGVADGTNISVYVNGIYTTTSAGGGASKFGFTGYTTPEFVIGYGFAGGSTTGSQWTSAYTLLLRGALTVQQLRKLEENPWQIFRPIFVPVKAPASGGITLTADQGTYTLTGQSVNLTIARRVTAAQGTYTLTGQDVTLRQGKTLTAAQGTYTLTGQSASLLVSRQISLAQGSYTLTGYEVTLTKSGGDKTLAAGQGTYTLAGQDVSLSLARKLTAEQGTYTLNGQDAGLNRNGRVLQAAQGTYTLNGQEVTLNYSGQPPNAYDIVLARRRLRK